MSILLLLQLYTCYLTFICVSFFLFGGLMSRESSSWLSTATVLTHSRIRKPTCIYIYIYLYYRGSLNIVIHHEAWLFFGSSPISRWRRHHDPLPSTTTNNNCRLVCAVVLPYRSLVVQWGGADKKTTDLVGSFLNWWTIVKICHFHAFDRYSLLLLPGLLYVLNLTRISVYNGPLSIKPNLPVAAGGWGQVI